MSLIQTLPQFITPIKKSVEDEIKKKKKEIIFLKDQGKYLCVYGCDVVKLWKHGCEYEELESCEMCSHARCSLCGTRITIEELQDYWRKYDVPKYMLSENNDFKIHWWQPVIFVGGIPDMYHCIKCHINYTQVAPTIIDNKTTYELPPFEGCTTEKPRSVFLTEEELTKALEKWK